MRFQFIHDHAAQYRMQSLCRVLGVSRSGYYQWCGSTISKRHSANEALLCEMRAIFTKSRRTYGSPRLCAALRQRGHVCNRKRIARLMRTAGIYAKTKRRFKITTQSRHRLPLAPNRLGQQFVASAPNRVWTSDITYLWTREGWVYVVVVMDMYSRLIVDWDMSDRLTAPLVTRTLRRALARRRPDAGLVLHSDRGSQYASEDMRALAHHHEIALSMSAKGNCYDNAVTESFFHTLKTEHTFFEQYVTREEARLSIFEYIETFYNRSRLHSTLGYLSPVDYEAQHCST